ncbi:sulfite exporter TauE/SafE family protein [Candidatus Kaiserbacteria bacterium]|nr:sulfite exporter TauE/SafE family protein [Candidatus Kaiserbacteria bacterium]
MKTYTLHVTGMHCTACPILIESELDDLSEVSLAKASLKHHSVEVTGDFGDKEPEYIARDLSEVLKPHGYSLSVERQRHVAQWTDFKLALPIALAFAVGFLLLQKAGLVNLVNTGTVSYGTAFAVGIVASLSTCMAVVGGLVLSMSATFAKEGDKVKPQLLFHAGRLVSFFVLGGVIGAIGSAFALNTTATFVLSMLIAIVMLILGINLLDVFHWSKRLQPSMPRFLARHAYGASKLNHTLTPLLVGIATFFLPCGFTQSMQIYTLSTGSFLTGAFTMGSFALGTLPVLGLISFSSFSIHDRAYAGVFFKTAGLIVILFAVVNLINSFVVIGLVPPLFSF